jgi:DNA-binding GntR family transcriptional regulator
MVDDQTTLAERALRQIYELIMSGELVPGAELNEVAISQRFDIGRGPVREALRRLQGRKLITREPYLRARVVSLSSVDLREIFQLREAVEGMAARLCAEKITQPALAEMERNFEADRERQGRNGERPPIFDLHSAIAEHCGNTWVKTLLCDELYDLLRLYRLKSGGLPGRRNEAAEEHWQILRAVRVGDPELAERLMRAHIARATRVLLEAGLPHEVTPSVDTIAAAKTRSRRAPHRSGATRNSGSRAVSP